MLLQLGPVEFCKAGYVTKGQGCMQVSATGEQKASEPATEEGKGFPNRDTNNVADPLPVASATGEGLLVNSCKQMGARAKAEASVGDQMGLDPWYSIPCKLSTQGLGQESGSVWGSVNVFRLCTASLPAVASLGQNPGQADRMCLPKYKVLAGGGQPIPECLERSAKNGYPPSEVAMPTQNVAP
uniref:Uncharacterized protein n=1 Tax=Eutreptiella gymnastica TaxID=73025 RepID=A0A7S1HXQ9_9EUGL|mmetsp:Transcript_113454/g.197027  ORF Transcript_113454/g.197027 Transcript_113454/m.197027 type:complete len:184 (+) Transcript_113454:316-867(+)